MSQLAAAEGRTAWRGRIGTEVPPPASRVDARRVLQLALAGIWLLDGALQYQPFMYTQAFPASLAETSGGNPAVIAEPITWDASLVGHHLVLLNTIFATIQVVLGLGIAFRPTVKAALAASVGWSVAVWWFGEGLGGVLNGGASPLSGAPGGVILYALLAVLLWPAGQEKPAPFIAARAVGARAARVLWLALWGSLAYFALTPANRAPQAVSGAIAGMESGQPGWLLAIERGATSLVTGQDLATSIALAAALGVIAVGIFLPRPGARAAAILALVAAVLIWVAAQAFGMILAGGATDPNSGPLLMLLALAYWPAGERAVSSAGTAASTASGNA